MITSNHVLLIKREATKTISRQSLSIKKIRTDVVRIFLSGGVCRPLGRCAWRNALFVSADYALPAEPSTLTTLCM